MKLAIGDSNLKTISIVVSVVFSLIVPAKSQNLASKYDVDEFPIPVSMYIEEYLIFYFYKSSRG